MRKKDSVGSRISCQVADQLGIFGTDVRKAP